MEGKNIAILATLRGDDSAYSLCNVINDQIKMFVNNGYKIKVFVTKGFKPERMFAHENVEICELPDQDRKNTISVDETFEEDVDLLVEAMTKALKDVDVLIAHDIVYQPDALKHNVALRVVAEKMKVKCLHWIHSATSPYRLADLLDVFPEKYKEITKTKFDNSYYVFFNDWSKPRIAAEYSVSEDDVKIVHHPTDYPHFAKYHEVTKKLIDRYDLLSKDYIDVYPARLDEGKQLENPIKLIASLKKMGFSVQFIAVDFHSSSNDPNDPKFKYRNRLKETAKKWGLTEDEVVFISEFCEETKVRVPEGMVTDLFDLSNIFFMSSVSESYSLVTQEAALKNNLLILNRNFPPLRDIFGNSAIFWPCNSNVDIVNMCDGESKVNYKNDEHEMFDYLMLAKMVVTNTINKQEQTRRKLLKERSLDYVFKKELEPIIYQICKK